MCLKHNTAFVHKKKVVNSTTSWPHPTPPKRQPLTLKALHGRLQKRHKTLTHTDLCSKDRLLLECRRVVVGPAGCQPLVETHWVVRQCLLPKIRKTQMQEGVCATKKQRYGIQWGSCGNSSGIFVGYMFFLSVFLLWRPCFDNKWRKRTFGVVKLEQQKYVG